MHSGREHTLRAHDGPREEGTTFQELPSWISYKRESTQLQINGSFAFSFLISVYLFCPRFSLFLSISKSRPDPTLGNRPSFVYPKRSSRSHGNFVFLFLPHARKKMVFRLQVLPIDLEKCTCQFSLWKSCQASSIFPPFH